MYSVKLLSQRLDGITKYSPTHPFHDTLYLLPWHPNIFNPDRCAVSISAKTSAKTVTATSTSFSAAFNSFPGPFLVFIVNSGFYSLQGGIGDTSIGLLY